MVDEKSKYKRTVLTWACKLDQGSRLIKSATNSFKNLTHKRNQPNYYHGYSNQQRNKENELKFEVPKQLKWRYLLLIVENQDTIESTSKIIDNSHRMLQK
ncbi:hypothetical protein FXO38_16269 [Capsicum annuum]|nr:hypothetical protein FXO38_16269 [Capsicum annuum]KAF3659809.1 hypothetical protein FXO37_13818 [Capsicum annuum]